MNLPQLSPTSVITSANLFTSKSVFILSAWSLTAFHYQFFIYYEVLNPILWLFLALSLEKSF